MRTRRANRLLEQKIKSPAALKRAVSLLKKSGKTVVFTNGCFDLLHYGHVKYLEVARKNGDLLVVAINSDASVRRIKGRGRPLVSQTDRIRIIAGLESVDYVTVFAEDTPLRIIKLLKPDILVKGSDWNKTSIVGRDIVSGYGGKVLTVKLMQGRSTTKLIKKIVQTAKSSP